MAVFQHTPTIIGPEWTGQIQVHLWEGKLAPDSRKLALLWDKLGRKDRKHCMASVVLKSQ